MKKRTNDAQRRDDDIFTIAGLLVGALAGAVFMLRLSERHPDPVPIAAGRAFVPTAIDDELVEAARRNAAVALHVARQRSDR